MWLNLTAPIATPVRTKKVAEIAETYFSDPRELFSEVVIGVSKRFTSKPFNDALPLKVISPPEQLYSILLAVKRDVIDEGKNPDRWYQILNTISMRFIICEDAGEAWL